MKKIILIIILLLISVRLTSAQEVNEKYSFKAFPYHNLSFKDRPVEEFNNTIIVGSCFYQEASEGAVSIWQIQKDIFPDGMTGVIFKRCNLDNVYVPPGNTAEDGTNKKIAVQYDWEDWILDSQLKPVEPMDKEQRLKANVSIKPKDIPKKKWTREERDAFEDILYSADIVPAP